MKQKLRPDCHVYHYSDVVSFLQTGDVILFHGIEAHSILIEGATMSYWSHAAILIRKPSDEIKELYRVNDYLHILEHVGAPFKDPELEDLYIFESDYDTFTKNKGGGAQLIPFKAWLIDYEREYSRLFLVVRRLVCPNRTGNNIFDFPKLEPFMKTCADKKYKVSRRQLVGAVGRANRKEDLESVFCSELVAATLKEMDFLEEHKNCTNITPKDFAKESYKYRLTSSHFGKHDFELGNGASLADAVRIIYNRAKYSDKVHQKQHNSPALHRV